MLIVDAHQDIAWNMLSFGRDYTRSAAETRRLEAGSDIPRRNDDALLGWPDYQRARTAVVIASLFVEPLRAVIDPKATQVYAEPRQANRLLHRQMDTYERLADQSPDYFRLITTRADLAQTVEAWRTLDRENAAPETHAVESDPQEQAGLRREQQTRAAALRALRPEEIQEQQSKLGGPPVGLVISMEGAEAIMEPAEVEAWWERGVRLVGPAWHGTPYSGGTLEPGPLTRLGFELLERMAALNMGLDLTHLDETAARQALDAYPGTLLASHSNAEALLKDGTNRHLSDRVMTGIIERDGVIGISPFIAFLKPGWVRGGRREAGSLAQIVAHIDYVCQMAGDARHVGFGTDFDGGFGLQSVPPEIDSMADLHKLTPLLVEKGYTGEDLDAIFGENWLKLLERILPQNL
jgi:membrane dipeptidase